MQKSDKPAVAASVTVYPVADMTDNGRKEVCDWLRKLADDLQNEPEAFANTGTFRALYLYPTKSHRPSEPEANEGSVG